MTPRGALFKVHGWLGVSVGLVLAVTGGSGAMLAFEDEIMAALSPGVVTLAPGATAARLSPDALIGAIARQRPGRRVAQLVIERDPDRTDRVVFAPPPGGRRGEQSYLDPRDGRLLGQATGAGFFRTVEDIHRKLLLPGGVASLVTGTAATAMVFFALSGIYLRWPKRPLAWRTWLVLDLRRGGRPLYRALHRVVGGWLFLLYLFSALTGLWWSFDWYQRGARYLLTGKAASERPAGKTDTPAGAMPALDPAWRAFLRIEGGRFDRVAVTVPARAGPLVMRELPRGARHDRMTDDLSFDAASGRLMKVDRYADRRAGDAIARSFHPFHTGAFFGLAGRIALFLAAATVPMFTVTGLLLFIGRERQVRTARRKRSSAALSRRTSAPA